MGVIYKNGISYSGGGSSGGGEGQIIQVTSLPTPSIDCLNTIYQYIGTTDANYTNGYFYKCVEENSSYIWKNIKTQSISGIFTINGNTLVIADA